MPSGTCPSPHPSLHIYFSIKELSGSTIFGKKKIKNMWLHPQGVWCPGGRGSKWETLVNPPDCVTPCFPAHKDCPHCRTMLSRARARSRCCHLGSQSQMCAMGVLHLHLQKREGMRGEAAMSRAAPNVQEKHLKSSHLTPIPPPRAAVDAPASICSWETAPFGWESPQCPLLALETMSPGWGSGEHPGDGALAPLVLPQDAVPEGAGLGSCPQIPASG